MHQQMNDIYKETETDRWRSRAITKDIRNGGILARYPKYFAYVAPY